MEIQASELKTKEGVAKDYATLHGHILMRKPEMLRVLGQYLGISVFDMASDGKNFTIYPFPPSSKTVKGSNAVKKKSANPLGEPAPRLFSGCFGGARTGAG